jgi:hypothetical protein
MYSSPSSYSAYNYPTQSVSKPLQESDFKYTGGGLTDITGAKAIAKRIFEMYDRDRDGNISNMEVVPMMVDAYQGMNRRFQPNKQDIDSFYKICDRNKDGRVNYEDVEALCIKYLTTGYMKEEMGGYK